MSNLPQVCKTNSKVGLGIAIGVAIGTAVGSATGNMGQWLGLGMGLGIAMMYVAETKNGALVMGLRPKRMLSFTTTRSPDYVLKTIVSLAQ
jgi:hypothetical protein